MAPPDLSRRRLLRAALATGGGALTAPLLAACSSGHRRPALGPATSARPSPVVNTAPTAAIAGETRLLAAYGAVLQRHPELAAVLAVPLAHHRIHARALGLSRLPTPGTPGPPVSTDAREAVRSLLVLEQQSADSRAAEAVSDLVNGSLLAAIGAADAVHADLLSAALPLVA
ncbi:MAG TPA: hypothetical protein VGN54_13290, partial [Mycobacteriales bacterium]|nr:hypothetical protein [Mycobacteriales bacterium]